MPVVYAELRRLAAHKLAGEDSGQTLQPTALVHEAWLKLQGVDQRWNNKGHFFAAAAEAMRRILIDKARAKGSRKRGENPEAVLIDESRFELRAPPDEALAVHEALDRLALEDSLAAEVVKLRYFVGMTVPEIAVALEISPRSADRHWSFARAWLRQAIEGDLLA